MFVNYCGSRINNVRENIRAAITECRSKHGYMLQSVIFPASTPLYKSIKPVAVSGI
jgi:hypothetical protein